MPIWTDIRPPKSAQIPSPVDRRFAARILCRLLVRLPVLASVSAAAIGLVVVASQQSATSPDPIVRDAAAHTAIRPMLIDLNTATVAELATLPGVGASRAETIALLRAQQPFRSLADLADRGILRPAEIIAIADVATVYVDID